MAPKQRGESRSRQKEAEIREDAEKLKLSLELSDEEAPEEVTFEASKAAAFQSLKAALESARREKEELKEKRRRRQEFFQEQKKKQLLPADVSEKIEPAPLKKQKQSEDEAEEEEDEGNTEKMKLPPVRILKGSYTVTTVKEREAADYQRQAAEDFIRSRLYGPGSCRSTNNELLSLQNKRGANKGAAAQFVKKNWACEKKAKAERLKKRWIHRQQNPSS